MRDFENRTVVVTGVGKEGQVGEVVARTFVDAGANLVLVDRERDTAHARAAPLQTAGQRVDAFAADLSDARSVDALASAVQKLHSGGIDALVNLAGGFAMSGAVAASDPEVWQRQFAINLTTAYLATRALLPGLRAKRGAIVYVASASVLPGNKVSEMSAYVAAKSGVVALMRAVAAEERTHGIRANAIAPTAIRTAANIGSMGDGAKYVEREDVAATIRFLCSDAARAVSGQLIPLTA